METGQGLDLIRRVQDLTSGQYLDLSADAPTFDVPQSMDPDAQVAFLSAPEQRLYFAREDGCEDFVQSPELSRLDRRQHDEQCLVTTGNSDERGRRVYWLCRVER
jgi:hypothetical protein